MLDGGPRDEKDEGGDCGGEHITGRLRPLWDPTIKDPIPEVESPQSYTARIAL